MDQRPQKCWENEVVDRVGQAISLSKLCKAANTVVVLQTSTSEISQRMQLLLITLSACNIALMKKASHLTSTHLRYVYRNISKQQNVLEQIIRLLSSLFSLKV